MCGIAGIIYFDGRSVEESILRRMNNAQVHRGPDDSGIYISENVGLGHRRLTIIDLEGGQQPFVDAKENYVLSYNGEVYNYKEIRRKLEKDFEFISQSDTEVILRAYQKWGINCLQHFRGMFAFALYDKRKGLLFLVRDRVGIKPLYYYLGKGRLVFGSELTSLLKSREFQAEINPESLSSYFKYQYVSTPLTIYNDVHKLEPGCFLLVDVHTGRVEKKRYWNLNINIVERDEESWLEELNATLEDTIRIYVRSDVPFGSFLSGGVDSSLVTALMSKVMNEPVRTFSIGFDEAAHSELPFARKVSDILKTDHYERVVSFKMSLDVIEKLAKHFGEPFADSSAIPTYYVCKEASGQVKMVLSGDGGDELFAGYYSYQITYKDFINPVSPVLRQAYRLIGKYSILPRISHWAYIRGLNPQKKHNSHRELFVDSDLQGLLIDYADYSHDNESAFNVDSDPITEFQAQDFRTYLVDDILTKVDRMSMANSLEVRVPLLDHKVVELAFSLPLSLKIRMDNKKSDLITKYLLKKSAFRFFPESFLNRSKMGFGIPIVEWCSGALKPYIEEMLRDSTNPIFNYVHYHYVQKILTRLSHHNQGVVTKIWFLLMFDLWMKKVHLDN
jgi:asparagine synthase (glutamine-hydrolysing)